MVQALDAGEPLFAEGLPFRKSSSREVAETVVVQVNARDRRGDGLELEPVVDELPDELDERGVYGRAARVRV